MRCGTGDVMLQMLGGMLCVLASVVLFAFGPGVKLVRLGGCFALFASFLLLFELGLSLESPPILPLLAVSLVGAFCAGWSFAKLLHRAVNEKPVSSGNASPETGLRKIP